MNSSIASALGAAISCPLDVIKTRIQVTLFTKFSLTHFFCIKQVAQTTNHSFNYDNLLNAIRKIISTEGYRAFAKGLFARILWISPSTAISMALCKIL